MPAILKMMHQIRKTRAKTRVPKTTKAGQMTRPKTKTSRDHSEPAFHQPTPQETHNP
jgi:hypothetical protein